MAKKVLKRAVTLLMAIMMVIAVTPMQIFALGSVTTYEDFMIKLKQLEVYADEYASSVHRDPGELVLNFIRTGVERYQDDNWTTLAGEEIVGFTNYVEAQDAKTEAGEEGYENNVKNVMDLRDIVTKDFILPNGNHVDFGHMFGCMNISYVNKGSADLSGWAGDLCDLLRYCVELGNITGSVEEMAEYIGDNCFGVDASEAFGWDDFWGDMDAYYLITEYQKYGGAKKFSELMLSYFGDSANPGNVSGLDDTIRTVYFMNNRFGVEDSQAAVRRAIYEAYSSDVGIKILESKRGLSSYNALRQACCYAIADYIYEKAQGKLIEGNGGGETASNGYYSVFSDAASVLAPGITQNIKYAQTVDGKQIVYYVATVDVTRDDVMIMANYKDNDPSKGWGLQTVMDQTNALVKNYKDKYDYFTPVVATNGDGYNIYNGTPGGLLVMDGKEWHGVDHDGFFAIISSTDDQGNPVDKAIIGTKAEYAQYKDQIKEAIGGFGAVLVKDGKINVTKNPNYTASRASRTAIGITAEGKVVMMVMDGRQQPFSAGGSMEEIAQVMLEAGCVHAINLDGGGSTTYLSKPAGSDNIQLVNRPSDGYQRLVAVSLVAISTAKPSNEFDKAIISSDYDYITAGTSMLFSVKGVSNTGNAAVIPEGSCWKVSDESLASIDENGLFTAQDYGTVKVQFVVNGEVKGEKVIHIVIPDGIKFVEDRITAIYGVPKEIGVTVWYQGYPVAFTPYVDAVVLLERRLTLEEKKVIAEESGIDISEVENYTWDVYSDAGVIEGLTFTGDESQNVRTANIIAVVVTEQDEIAKLGKINLYRKDEATFDFDNATQGNRALAWLREIENARSTDNKLYRIIDPTKPIKIDYTFALDMTAIEMPAQLEPLKSMLPDGTNPDAAAWDFLLSLAERICVQTNVTIRAEFSPELNVDISGLKVVTDYFELTSVNLDENNVLTLICNWKDQTQAIDPATANPLCILTGITATVKDSASYFNNEVVITNNGTVTYDIYLATSALHSFASDPENQAQYGLYPYEHSDEKYPSGCRGDDHDTGGHFSSQYLDFADVYVVNTEIRQGWQEEDGDYYFYKDNVAVTGTQLVIDRHDATKLRFYEFGEDGKLVNEQGANGLIWLGEDLFYAVLGEAQTGWQVIEDNNYYFHPDTGKAVDGQVKILEYRYPEDTSMGSQEYTYIFKDHILVYGQMIKETMYLKEYKRYETGYHYRWAGHWMRARWFEIDGETYHVTKNYPYFITTGFSQYVKNYPNENDLKTYLFSDTGVLQKNFTGPATVLYKGAATNLFFKNGMLYTAEFFGTDWHKGIIQGTDGYYYFVNDDGTVVQNAGKYVGVAESGADWRNDLVETGWYEFDIYGRMKADLLTDKINSNGSDKITFINNTPASAKATTSVMGRVMKVTSSVVCKVLCKVNGVYQMIEAKIDPYATATTGDEDTVQYQYDFAIPQNATEIKIVVAGDLNGNGQVDQDDVAHLKDSILGKNGKSLTEEQKLLCDANGDGKFTAVDVALINAASKNKKKLDW